MTHSGRHTTACGHHLRSPQITETKSRTESRSHTQRRAIEVQACVGALNEKDKPRRRGSDRNLRKTHNDSQRRKRQPKPRSTKKKKRPQRKKTKQIKHSTLISLYTHVSLIRYYFFFIFRSSFFLFFPLVNVAGVSA